MHKGFLQTAAILAGLSVAFGAFGAHSLKQVVSDPVLSIFETGVRYQFYHSLALLAVGILYKDFTGTKLKWAGLFFIAGVILFSGSLYGLTFIKARDIGDLNWVGIFTPIGGLSFILGWILIVLGIADSRAKNSVIP